MNIVAVRERTVGIQSPSKWCQSCGWSGHTWGSRCPDCGASLADSRQREAGPDAYLRAMLEASELGEDVDWGGVFSHVDIPAEATEPAIEQDYEWIRRGC